MKTRKLSTALALVAILMLAMTVSVFAEEVVDELNGIVSVTGETTDTVPVTVTVIDSTGAPLSGVDIDYQGMYRLNFGITNSDGETIKNIKPGNYNFIAKYKGTTSIKPVTIDAENNTVTFETANITVEVKNSKGEPINDSGILYRANGTNYHFGRTGENGSVNRELFPGSYMFIASYKGTSSIQESVPVNNGSVVSFKTTNVKLHFSGKIRYKAGGYAYYYSEEMFPGTYEFLFSGNGHPEKGLTITVPDDSNVEKSIAYVTLLDSKGKGIIGANINYYNGVWNNNQGTTDEKGTALVAIDGSPSKPIIQVSHKGGKNQKQQAIKENSFFDFQTKLVTFELLDSKGNIIDPEQYRAHFYAVKWQNLEDIVDGKYQIELLPASYPFGVRYHGGWNQDYVDITKNPNVVFQTGAAKIIFSGTTKYYSGNWYNYTDQVELLPGTYRFSFRDSSHKEKVFDIQVEKGKLTQKSIAYVTLLDSKGKGIAGANINYYAGVWHNNQGTTDENGTVLIVIDGSPSKPTIQVSHKGGKIQKQQVIKENSFYDFQTVLVTFELLDSEGNPIDPEKYQTQFYAGKWQNLEDIVDGKYQIELLPASYSFGVRYLGGWKQQDKVNIAEDPNIVFTTKLVTFELLDSEGNPIDPEKYQAQFYAGKWQNFEDIVDGKYQIELLPASYSFGVRYLGGWKQQDKVNIAEDPNIVF